MAGLYKTYFKRFDKLHLYDRVPYLYYQTCWNKQAIVQNSILLWSYNGINLHGNIFYIAKELAENSRYAQFELYLPVRWAHKREFEDLLSSHGLTQRIKLIPFESLTHIRLLASARYIITDEQLPPWFLKKPGQILWQTWHGAGPKAAGVFSFNIQGLAVRYQHVFSQADYFSDLFDAHTDYLVDAYHARRLIRDEHVLVSGYPRNDAFNDLLIIKQARLCFGDAKRIYAYYPTFRSKPDSSQEDRSTVLMERLKELDGLLQDGEILLLKLHMREKAKVDYSAFAHVVPLPAHLENYEALAACDVLISDYSSVMLDFAQAHKKVIVWRWDESEYSSGRGWRVEPKDLPFPRVDSAEELVAELRSPINYDTSQLLEPLLPHRDAHVCERLVEQVCCGTPYFEDKTLKGSATSWGLVVPGASARSQGAKHLAQRARNVQSPEGLPAHLCLHIKTILKKHKLVSELPSDIEFLSWQTFPSAFGRTKAYTGGVLSTLLRALFNSQYEHAWKFEGKRLSGNGKRFQHVICDIDAGPYFLITVAHMDCATTLYATTEALKRCNKKLIQTVAGRYTGIEAEDTATAKALQELLGDGYLIEVKSHSN